MGFFSLDAPTQNAAFGSAVGLSAEGGSLIVGAPNSNEGEVGARGGQVVGVRWAQAVGRW